MAQVGGAWMRLVWVRKGVTNASSSSELLPPNSQAMFSDSLIQPSSPLPLPERGYFGVVKFRVFFERKHGLVSISLENILERTERIPSALACRAA